MSTEQRLEDVTAADIMQQDITTIPSTMPLAEVERVLSDQNISGAPVTDHAGNIAGVISMRDIMTHNADVHDDGRTLHPSWFQTLEEPVRGGGAAGRAAGDREARILAGLEDGADPDDAASGLGGDDELQQRELERMATGEAVPRDTDDTAAAVMTAQVHAVGADATVTQLAAIMVEQGIHRVLVRRNGKYVGLVSSTDVLRAIARFGRRAG